jgi:hypothetical protein
MVALAVGRKHVGLLTFACHLEKHHGVGVENAGREGEYGFYGITYEHAVPLFLLENRDNVSYQ